MELIGALLLLPVFVPRFGWEGGSGEAIFHAVSAFCNAGFDLLSTKQPYQSLLAYSTNVDMNLVIGFLILIGGLGFITWIDVRKHGWHIRRYHLQSKIVLVATVILLLVPMVYFFCCEFQNFPMKKRLLASFFQTVSPRTAGFNTVPLTQLSDNGKFMTILLMFIGGGTGSTAGGIKMTTAGVLFCACLAVIFRRREAMAFGRRIAPPDHLSSGGYFYPVPKSVNRSGNGDKRCGALGAVNQPVRMCFGAGYGRSDPGGDSLTAFEFTPTSDTIDVHWAGRQFDSRLCGGQPPDKVPGPLPRGNRKRWLGGN